MSNKEVESRIGYHFNRPALLEEALTHSSYQKENASKCHINYERLEFLGDAVLELISSKFLFHKYTDMNEGNMTKLRASLVCEQALAVVARQLKLGEALRLSRGEEATGGRDRDSIIADSVEAVIGAIFEDGGFINAERFILKFILNDIEHKQLFHDCKTVIQELVQKDYPGKKIVYKTVGESGPDHNKTFFVAMYLDEEKIGEGKGKTKKAAEQNAAYEGLLKLQKTKR
jgi:ribonuclease-3